MPFGVDFETNIGNRDFNVINCRRLYLGEATQKSVMQHLDASTQEKQGYPSLNNDIYLYQ